jgi:hypothetical protein
MGAWSVDRLPKTGIVHLQLGGFIMVETTKGAVAPKKTARQITTTREGDLVHFDVLGEKRLTVNRANVSDANNDYAWFHGIKQRVVDAAALPWDGIGAKPTLADKYAEMVKIADHLNSGSPEWNVRGDGGGFGGGMALKAVAAIQGVPVEVMRERVERQAEKQGITPKAYLGRVAKLPAVVAKVAEMLRAAGGVDTDSMLDELNKKRGVWGRKSPSVFNVIMEV